jgi:hypothetical protein
MATLYVAEFVAGGGTANFPLAAAQTAPSAEQTVAIGGSSTQCTNAFKATTYIIRIHTDAICSIAWGTNPTASSANMRLAANQTEYFAVPLGANYKVAVITNN